MSSRAPTRRPPRAAALIVLALAFVLGACATQPAPTPVPAPTETATASPSPTDSATPTPTASPTATPTPTASPSASLPTVQDGAAIAGVDHCPGADAQQTEGELASSFSTNWSGYVTTATKRVVTCVESEWVQPKVSCHGSNSSSLSIWVGLGGFDQTSLEQIGTAVDCASGFPLEYSWHESLPRQRHEVDSPVPIKAGDRVWAQVRWMSGSTYQLSLANLTRPDGFTVRDTNTGLKRTEAEWIAEAPSSCSASSCHVLPMPSFGKITFDHISVTINGMRSTLKADGFTRNRVRLVASKGSTTRALVTATAADGSSFVVTWRHA